MRDTGRLIGRSALRLWSRMDVVPGYLYQAVERYGYALADDKLISGRLPNGCSVFYDLRDEVQRQMWLYGAYEPIESYLFCQLLKPGAVVVDAGANVGQYTLLASAIVGDSGSVHSFEPIPTNFARLEEHAKMNHLGNVFLNQAALWNEDSVVALGMPAGMKNNAGAFSVRAGDDSCSRIEARAARLDTYAEAKGLRSVDVIKMDIEGCEPLALRGASKIIERCLPTILMEVNQSALEGVGESKASLWALLSKLNYKAWRIGVSPETSGPVSDLDGFTQSNAIFYQKDLPASVVSGWTYRSVMRWARQNL